MWIFPKLAGVTPQTQQAIGSSGDLTNMCMGNERIMGQ